MTPTALSQVVERWPGWCSALPLPPICCITAWRNMPPYGTVYGQAAASLEDAQRLVLPVASAGAVAGISVSTACGSLFAAAAVLLPGWHHSGAAGLFPRARSRRELGRMLLTVALPVCPGLRGGQSDLSH